jgi:hypothetical protein
MKQIVVIFTVAVLAGCGAETATTAATAAAARKQEMEQAKKTQEAVRQKLDQATEETGRAREDADTGGR